MTDSLTIIRAHGRRLAQLIRADGGIDANDRARRVELIEHPLGDLAARHRLLLRLRQAPAEYRALEQRHSAS